MAKNMDVNGLKFVDEGDHQYMVQSANGMTFPIAKKDLDENTIKVIKSLPKLKSDEVQVKTDDALNQAAPVPEGTPIAMNAKAPTPPPDNKAVLNQALNEQMGEQGIPGFAPAPTVSMPPQAPVSAQPQAPQSVVPPPQTPIASPVQGIPQPGMGGFAAPMNQMRDAYKQEVAAADQGYKAQLDQNKQLAEQNAAIKLKYETERNALKQETEAIQKDVSEGKIDPGHFWKSQTGIKGGVNRVMAIIGLFLGGLSQNKTGVNPAAKAIDDLVNRDIDAQKEEMGKKNNLLKMKLQQYQDLGQAENAAKLDMYNMFGAQLKMVEAQTSNQMVKAKAQQGLAELGFKLADLQNKIAEGQANRMIDMLKIQSTLGANKPMTESQAKANAFASGMLQAEQVITGLSQNPNSSEQYKGTERSRYIPNWATPDLLKGDQRRQYEQAADQFSENYGRFVSGGAITPQERNGWKDIFYPKPGDNEATVAQKTNARRLAIENINRASGQAPSQTQPITSFRPK